MGQIEKKAELPVKFPRLKIWPCCVCGEQEIPTKNSWSELDSISKRND